MALLRSLWHTTIKARLFQRSRAGQSLNMKCMSSALGSHLVPTHVEPPYSADVSFTSKYKATCFCKRVTFTVSMDPLAAKICDCSVCMRLHGAPMQWAAIFKKDAVCFAKESIKFIRWYSPTLDVEFTDITARTLPCKLQCKHCGTWIADEGRNMFMAFPTLFNFVNGGAQPEFPAGFLPTYRIFCSTKALEHTDGLPSFTDAGATPRSVSDYLLAIAPRLDGSGHKGQAGRICILGGSIDFAGAPYYAGMSALRTGAELLYVCTALEAAAPIKAYSPELMVSDIYRWSHISSENAQVVVAEQKRMHDTILNLLPRLHAMTIGPGLGRDDRVLQAVGKVILSCKEQKLPLVIDADGLWLIERSPEILEGYKDAVLTPNIAEFGRLSAALTGSTDANPQDVCDRLRGPTLLLKGRIDRIFCPGRTPLECTEEGAPKRPGGLGDFLSGSLATLLAWAKQSRQDNRFACQAACTLVRRACKSAYAKKKRAMVAPDVLDELAVTFEELCPATHSRL